MGVTRAGRGRSVAVDADPNVHFFLSKNQYSSGGYPRFSQPMKTAYQHRDLFKQTFVKSAALVRWVWCGAPHARVEMPGHVPEVFSFLGSPSGVQHGLRSSHDTGQTRAISTTSFQQWSFKCFSSGVQRVGSVCVTEASIRPLSTQGAATQG